MGQLAEKDRTICEKHEEKLSPAFEKTKDFFKNMVYFLIIARFIPGVRSVAPFLAGVTNQKIFFCLYLLFLVLFGLQWGLHW